MLGPSFLCLKRVIQEAVLHVAVQLHSYHAAKWVVEGNGESSVTADKVLKVVAGVWMN